ncbi:hypothetical protein [Emticicia sp. TH156]|uniref:hypothetical protein n=1 Tax=Emticicia sp. TH156 TaxID=2067454 RepID=UPI000C78CA01|nr:hypothetical protein [Emticicia sp. TH156]PLK43915.1 hypothetical protein C0V77_12235 [Emticicia sp. TH156]
MSKKISMPESCLDLFLKGSKMMKINKIVFVILLACQACFSQKIEKYNYVIIDKIDAPKPYLGMELEFSTVRKYYNNNEFKESRLFTGSNDDFISFKKIR